MSSCPRSAAIRQPLAAAYRTELLGTVQELVAADRLRPAFLFERCRVLTLSDRELLADSALARLDPWLDSVSNLNEPADYQRALALAAPEIAVQRFRTAESEPRSRRETIRAWSLGELAAAIGFTPDEPLVAALNGDQISRDRQLPLAAGDTVAFRSPAEYRQAVDATVRRGTTGRPAGVLLQRIDPLGAERRSQMPAKHRQVSRRVRSRRPRPRAGRRWSTGRSVRCATGWPRAVTAPGTGLPPSTRSRPCSVSPGARCAALCQRLEESGEIVRRQGSGTFVGRMAVPTAFGERLERLEPYSSVAARRGVKLSAGDLKIEQRAVGGEAGEALGLEPDAHATTVSRTLLADGSPVAVMFDVVHPAIELPAEDRLRSALERGQMVLDVLIAAGVPVTFARTRVIPALLTAARAGRQAAGDPPHHRGARARGADLRRPRRPRRLFARPVRARGHRGDGDAVAGLAPARAGRQPARRAAVRYRQRRAPAGPHA